MVQSAVLAAEPKLPSRPGEITMTDQYHAWLEPQGMSHHNRTIAFCMEMLAQNAESYYRSGQIKNRSMQHLLCWQKKRVSIHAEEMHVISAQ